MHPFDQAITLQSAGDDLWAGNTSPDYANMVGPFGGITAATAMQAILLHPQRLGDPVALTLNYAGPVADGPFTLHTRIARTNRSTQHWLLELRQGDHIALTGTAVTALRRATWTATESEMPNVGAFDSVERMPTTSWAPWAQQYDMRVIKGDLAQALSGGGSADSESHVWIREAVPRALDFASLTAICDAFYPRLFIRRGTFVPVGTVSMTIYFHVDAAALAEIGDAAVFGQAKAIQFGLGFFDQSASIWSPARKILASTHQVVYFKE